jgi:hypothetical protein
MCLEFYVIPATENKVSAERIARESGLWVKKVNKPVKGAIRFSRDGGCSCSLLSEHADWDKPLWDLENDVLERLSAALQLLGKEAGGFTLRALWVGDEPETESEISLSEMLDEVRNNRVRNKHTYKVRA